MTTLVLFVAVPAFTVAPRRRPESTTRAIIVGDDPLAMESLLAAARVPLLGSVSPPSADAPEGIEAEPIQVTDGGLKETSLDALPCLGGVTQFEGHAELTASETFLRENSDWEVRPMARPVRFEWDDHDWSGKPHPHERPKEVRTNPQVASVGR